MSAAAAAGGGGGGVGQTGFDRTPKGCVVNNSARPQDGGSKCARQR